MHLTFRNVNDAFKGLLGELQAGGAYAGSPPVVQKPSRYGQVLMIDEPMMLTYTHPRERVLFNAARDCNPFFQLYEALWMLAGRNDVAPLAYYASRMPEFSDNGKAFNGAYGYRWRHSQVPDHQNWKNGDGVDQLQILIDHLRLNPDSRRAVLQMWNVENDLLKIDSSKDVCCNLSVLISLRLEPDGSSNGTLPGYFLDITVLNRSNDLTWGLLGSNYVCFSILQEYMAAHIETGVGKYHHFTNNLHAYTNKWYPEKWLADREPDRYMSISEGGFDLVPLVKDPATFDRELLEFVQFHGSEEDRCAQGPSQRWDEPFFESVAGPMLDAFHMHKLGDHDLALDFAVKVASDDWRLASLSWLRRRYAKRGLITEPEPEKAYDPDFAV